MPEPATLALEMKGISKRFPGVTALDGVDFGVRPGEVQLLMGENGAGKSTLMKILSGAYPKDSGSISLSGVETEIRSPHHGRELGIAMIYQEMTLVPQLSVAENIFLGREPARWGIIDRKEMNREASRLLARLHADFSPEELAGDLPVARQQMVEISRALSLNARILVMDEPTAPLSGREVTELFSIIRELRASGVAIVYISHRLEEARMIGDRVTVLRDGRLAGESPLAGISDTELIKLMVGRDLASFFPEMAEPSPKEVLRVEGLARPGVFGPVSFTVNAGEILGFAGLVGSGRTEIARCLAGADIPAEGTVTLDGKAVRLVSPRSSKKAGIALLPEDRKGQGLVLGLPVLENSSLPSLERFTRHGIINGKAERREVAGLVERMQLRPPDLDRVVGNLSGGNQQKVVLAKWLGVAPRVMVFDEPTRGIDVGAKHEVYLLMKELAAAGMAIIFISSDLTEVLGLSHRVAVMHQGKIAGIMPRSGATPENVMALAMGLARA
jgi:ribose transport system ATP-binding protein